MNKMHYEETQEEKRRRLNTGGNYKSGPLCGNGDAHAAITRHLKNVDCSYCIKKLVFQR